MIGDIIDFSASAAVKENRYTIDFTSILKWLLVLALLKNITADAKIFLCDFSNYNCYLIQSFKT